MLVCPANSQHVTGQPFFSKPTQFKEVALCTSRLKLLLLVKRRFPRNWGERRTFSRPLAARLFSSVLSFVGWREHNYSGRRDDDDDVHHHYVPVFLSFLSDAVSSVARPRVFCRRRPVISLRPSRVESVRRVGAPRAELPVL